MKHIKCVDSGLVMHACSMYTLTTPYNTHMFAQPYTIIHAPNVHPSNFSHAKVMSASLQCSVSEARQQHKAASWFHLSAAMN